MLHPCAPKLYQNVMERCGMTSSWVLISAALQLYQAQAQDIALNFWDIHWDNPLIWKHPMLSDELSSTREWFMAGCQMPGESHSLSVCLRIPCILIITYSTWCCSKHRECGSGLEFQPHRHSRQHQAPIKGSSLRSHPST